MDVSPAKDRFYRISPLLCAFSGHARNKMLLQRVYKASYTQITQTVGPLLSMVYLHAIFDGLFPPSQHGSQFDCDADLDQWRRAFSRHCAQKWEIRCFSLSIRCNHDDLNTRNRFMCFDIYVFRAKTRSSRCEPVRRFAYHRRFAESRDEIVIKIDLGVF